MRDGIGNQEWIDEFKAEVPALWEELPRAATRKRRRRQDAAGVPGGLRPELLDKEQIRTGCAR